MTPTPATFSRKVFAQASVQALKALRAFVVLPVIIKTSSAFYYGIWSQIAYLVTLLTPVLTLRLDVVFVRYFSSVKNRSDLRKPFISMLSLIIINLVLFSTVAFIFSEQLTKIVFKHSGLSGFLTPLIILLIIRTLFLFTLSYYRCQYQIGRYSLIESSLIIGDIIILMFSIIVLHYDLSHALYYLILYDLLVLLLNSISVLKKIGVGIPDFKYLKPYLFYALPLVPNVGLLWLVNFSDRYFITRFLDLDSVGVYAASYNLAQLLMLLVAPIGFVLYPTISKLWEEKNFKEVNFWIENGVKYFLMLAIPMVVGISHFGPYVLLHLASEEFIRHRWLIFLLSAGLLFFCLSQIYVYMIHLFEKTIWIMYVFIVITIVKIVMNIILIPVIGITGSAVATLVSYSLQFIIIFIIINRISSLKIPINFILKSLICSAVMFLVLQLFPKQVLLVNLGAALFGAFVYFLMMYVLKAVGAKEINLIREFITTFSLKIK